MAQDCKEKTCVDCNQSFKPTSNVQKRCPPCIEKHEKAAPWRKKKTEVKKTINVAKSSGSESSEDSFVLRMLVAAGLVSDEKIIQAREIVRKLKG